MPFTNEDSYKQLGPSLTKTLMINGTTGTVDEESANLAIEKAKDIPNGLGSFPQIRSTLSNPENENLNESSFLQQAYLGKAKYKKGSTQGAGDYSSERLSQQMMLLSPFDQSKVQELYNWYDPFVTLKSNLESVMLEDTGYLKNQRRLISNELTRELSFGQMWENWFDMKLNSDSEQISNSEAMQLAKELGVDLKFDKPFLTRYELAKKVEHAKTVESYQLAIANYNNTKDPTFLNQATLFLNSLVVGTMGSLPDASITLFTTFIAPTLLVGTAAKAGQVGLGALRAGAGVINAEKALAAANTVQRAQTIASVANATRTGIIAGEAAESGLATFGRTQVTNSFSKQVAAEIIGQNAKFADAAVALNDLSKIKYANLTWQEKALVDAGTWALTDVPQALFKKNYSDNAGIELYSSKEMAMEILLSGALGAVLPTGVRATMSAFGISPQALKVRQLGKRKMEVKAKMATGRMTVAEGTKQLKAITAQEDVIRASAGNYRKGNPVIDQWVENIASQNTSNETIMRQISAVYTMLKKGEGIDLSLIPNGERLFSNVDARLLQGFLENKSAEEVFGSALVKVFNKKSGTYSVQVKGEKGLLGNYKVFALTEQEALEQLKNLYMGTVLKDEQAFIRFKEHAAKYETFVERMTDIYESFNLEFDKGGGIEPNAFKKAHKQLVEAYLSFTSTSEEAEKIFELLDKRRAQRANGLEPTPLPEELNAKTKKAIAFADKYLKSKKSFKKLESLIEDIKKDTSDNINLANIDTIFDNLSAEESQRFIDAIEQGLPIENTEVGRILSSEITDFDSFKESLLHEEKWDNEVSNAKLNFENEKMNPEYSKAYGILDNSSSKENNTYSIYSRSKDTLQRIQEAKDSKYSDIKTKIVNAIRSNEKLQTELYTVLFEEGTRENIKAFKKELRNILSNVLKDQDVESFGISVDSITNHLMDFYSKQIKEDKDLLKAFLSLETLQKTNKELQQTGEQELAKANELHSYLENKFAETEEKLHKKHPNFPPEQVAETILKRNKKEIEKVGPEYQQNLIKGEELLNSYATKASELSAQLKKALQPLETFLNIELSKVELTSIHNIRTEASMLKNMMANMGAPTEAITGRATQTIYNFTGSGRNVESLTRTAADYEKALIYELGKETSEASAGGKATLSLADILVDESPENVQDIMVAIINLKHGAERGSSNSDIDRIAKTILKHNAILNNGFTKFGSTFNNAFSLIDRKRLKYIDAIINDTTAKGILDSVTHTDLKMVRRNLRIPKADTNYVIDITPILGINNTAHRKIALWAFRDLDLEEMFGRTGETNFNLNEVRDTVLRGSIGSLVKSKEELADFISDINYIFRKLISKKKNASTLDPSSWVFNFLFGFDKFNKVIRGIDSVYMNKAGSRIVFKDAESEINAIRNFGYRSVREAFTSNAETMIKAKYSLELFGSKPVELVQDVINTYNDAVSRGDLSGKVQTVRRDTGKSSTSFLISDAARNSAIRFTEYATGLQDVTGGWLARAYDATKMAFTSPLLVAAGVASVADFGTVTQALVNNALVNGHVEAMTRIGKAIQLYITDKKIFKLVSAAGLLQQDSILAAITNNPSVTVGALSRNLTSLDKYEEFCKIVTNFFLNKVGRMGSITNFNKDIGAMSIQMALGEYAKHSFKQLPDAAVQLCKRHGIDSIEWELIRNHLMVDLDEILGKGNFGKILNPFEIRNIKDEVIIDYLKLKNVNVITDKLIQETKESLLSNLFSLIDTTADEMVSLPTERIQSLARGGFSKGSAAAKIVETFTQYQSFGAALLYNTYGRAITKNIRGEVGISILDMLNPMVRLEREANRTQMHKDLLGAYLSVALTATLANTFRDALIGKVDKLWFEDRGETKINWDLIRKRTFDGLGTGGVLLDAIWNGIDSKGQASGGIAFQGAPFLSMQTRNIGKILKPMRSDEITNKGSATSAATINAIAQPVKRAPVFGLVFQSMFGAYLDMIERGGIRRYEEALRARERRGQVTMPWEKNPTWLIDKLQGY